MRVCEGIFRISVKANEIVCVCVCVCEGECMDMLR